MRSPELLKISILTSVVWVSIIYSAKSVETLGTEEHDTSVAKVQTDSTFIKDIRRISEMEHFSKSAVLLVQSPTPTNPPSVPSQEEGQQSVVPVTEVRAIPTSKGVEVILQTAQGDKLQLVNRSAANSFIVDVPNAQLRSPNGDAFIFRSERPMAGIVEITATNIDAKTIRVTVTGEKSLPSVELFDSKEGLIIGITSVASSAQNPTPSQSPTQERSADDSQQPQTQAQPTQPSVQGDEPIELVVTGQQNGYNVPNASTATKTDTPLRDIPQSIQVVPRQVLKDQQVIQIRDALRNVSGISPTNGSLTSFSQGFISRGFTSGQNNYFTNGIRQYSQSGVPLDTANIEQIEVLKGPASVLYGQAEPGGIVNLVTKQPLAEPYYAAELTIGSYDFYRPAIDISGPLNTDKTARYRLNVGYQNSGSFVDFLEYERLSIAPVFSFDLGKNTNLILEGGYFSNSTPDYDGLPAVGSVLPNPLGRVRRSIYLDDPDLRNQFRRFSTIGYRLQHKFNDNWSVRNSFTAEFLDIDDGLVSLALQPNNRTVTRTGFVGQDHWQFYTLQTDILGTIQTGKIKQDLLLGLELRRAINDFERFSGTLPPIDLFNPTYNRPPVRFTNKILDSSQQQNFLGVYLQDLISLGDKIKILLGGRFDLVDQEFDNRVLNRTFNQQDTAFSPRAGIVYQPIEPVSLYASYSRSFISSGLFSVNADGTPFEPTKGRQYEVGVKTELFDGKLLATLAAYEITKQNIVTTDPNRTNFSIQVGEQRSRGIELDVVGQPIPGLNLIATYAYTNAEITQDNRPNIKGNEPENVPRHSASFWATYQIQGGSFKGLGFGAGLFFVGDRKGDLTNTFTLPNYVRTDAAIFYRRENWQAALNFKNIFDVYYFESAVSRNNVFPGEPFTILGSISVQF
jgi:iron complex outermembrane recepter protein